jgi:response regulator RpfG family c-di-GMP phosphodiesterase
MDGWAILEEMESIENFTEENVSLFILSSSVNPKEIERANNHKSVQKFVQKPINTEILSDVLNKKTVI